MMDGKSARDCKTHIRGQSVDSASGPRLLSWRLIGHSYLMYGLNSDSTARLRRRVLSSPIIRELVPRLTSVNTLLVTRKWDPTIIRASSVAWQKPCQPLSIALAQLLADGESSQPEKLRSSARQHQHTRIIAAYKQVSWLI